MLAFAEQVLRVALLPWQRWWLIHALELSIVRHPVTGRRALRFRTLLTLVARQQGKTFLLRILALWAMFVRRVPMVLGAAQSLIIARECWQGAVDLARSVPDCAAEIPVVGGVRYANGEQCLTLGDGQRYRITACTRGAGRGLTVDVLLLDELREHRDYLPWAALSKTTLARPESIICAVTNAGDDGSVVLNDLRTRAIEAITRCRADDPDGPDPAGGLFLAEWSAPEGCALDDPRGWCQAMPGLNIDVIGSDGSYLPAPITTEAVSRLPGHRPAQRVPHRTAVYPGRGARHRVRPHRLGGLRGPDVQPAGGARSGDGVCRRRAGRRARDGLWRRPDCRDGGSVWQ